MTIAHVGLDVPVMQLFEYSATDATASDVGRRVLVPFGRRAAVGVILKVSDAPSTARKLKQVSTILRDILAFSAEDLRLLQFAADYYHYPLGQVVMMALPLRLRRTPSGSATPMSYALTAAGRDIAPEALSPRAVAKRRVLDALRAHGTLSAAQLQRFAPSAPAAVREFLARGWVERVKAPEHVMALSSGQPVRELPLTGSQTAAVDAIRAQLDDFSAFLLFGVTGSGKTEVYLHAAEPVLAAGRQVLMLVPEIALTPQLEAMVQARFLDAPLVSLHSGLNENERLRNWLRAQSGDARIVLGTRLAVFTPLPRLGLIVVDEEHDTSFKQTEGFCYSARDLAVVRASQRGIPVVLGSATPALETWQNALSGRYTLLELPERINGRPPSIATVPLAAGKLSDGLAPALTSAISQKLERREQSLVFINRRGYAPVVMCSSCGWLSDCHRCSAKLVLHLPARELRCHHCGYRAPVPSACPACGNPALRPLGQGTQRVEEVLAVHFPTARILRIDRDSTRRKHAWTSMRERIRAREVDILVGTQILAKGHDFPHLALVGVLNADSMLYSSDFRAAERLYALLTQVAGRAGRGDAQGDVLVQTEFPDHPVYVALQAQDFAQFASAALEQRRQARFPPFVHQALLRSEAPQVATALEFLEAAKSAARDIAGSVELFDPVPATMVRLAGRERAQLLVQSGARAALHDFLRTWHQRLAVQKSRAARWTLEVDPLEL